MSRHPWSTDIDRFLAHLLASQLVPQSKLEETYLKWQAEYTGRRHVAVFCARLIEDDLLTEWQCQQLQEGKYWGFFIDDYRVDEYLRTDDKYDKYLACETSTGQRVILEVQSPAIAPLHNGRLAYRVNRAPGTRRPETSDSDLDSPLADPQISVFFSDSIRSKPDRNRMLAELSSVTIGDLPPGAQPRVHAASDEPSDPPRTWSQVSRASLAGAVLVVVILISIRWMRTEPETEKVGNLYQVMEVGMTANRVETVVRATRGPSQWQDDRAFIDDTGRIRYPLGSGAYLIVHFGDLYEPPGNILAQDRVTSFNFIHFDDLRGEIHDDLLPLVRRIHLASFNGFNLQPVQLIQTVNLLHSVGKKQAIDALTSYYNLARNDSARAWKYNLDANRIFLLARLLFVPEDASGEMAIVHLDGQAPDLQLQGNQVANFPLILIDDVPLSLLSGFQTAGAARTPGDFLKFCRDSCQLRSHPLTPTRSPIKTIENLIQSKRMKSELGNSFLLAKSLLRVQATRCVEGVLESLPKDYQKQLNCNLFSALETDGTWRTIRKLDRGTKVQWNVAEQVFKLEE